MIKSQKKVKFKRKIKQYKMKNSDYQQFQRRNQLFQNQTRQNDLTKKLLQKQLQYQRLYDEYTQLLRTLQGTYEQNNHLKQSLKDLIPQNSWLKKQFQGVKATLGNIKAKEEEFVTQLIKKDELIQELNAHIQKISQKQENRRSDLSGIGQLVNSLDEKTKLEEQIQKHKRQRMQQNQKYQEKLQKKDQIIKRINTQTQQSQVYYKELLTKKTRLTQSLEQQLRDTKRKNQQLLCQINNNLQNQDRLTEQMKKLQNFSNGLSQNLDRINRENQQIKSKNNELNKANRQIQTQNQEIKRQNDLSLRVSTNVSRQVQLKEEYVQLLENSKKQLVNSQLELQKASSLIQSKDSQLRFKEQQLSQLRANITNHQQYHAYLERSVLDLQNDKSSTLRKFQEKDQSIRNLENKLQYYHSQIQRQRSRISELDKQKQRPKTPNQKSESTQHFYDCNNQKQLLENDLKETKIHLQNQTRKTQECLKQINNLSVFNNRLKSQLQNERLSKSRLQANLLINEASNINSLNYQKELRQLRQERSNQQIELRQLRQERLNYQKELRQLRQQRHQLQVKLSQESVRLQQKAKKLFRIQTELRNQYSSRINSLQKQIHLLTYQAPKQGSLEYPEVQNSGTLVLDGWDNEVQLRKYNKPQQINRLQQIDGYLVQANFKSAQKKNTSSSGKSARNQPDARSKNSKHLQYDPDIKTKYQQLRVQNDSLRAHLQRLSSSLLQNKQKLVFAQNQNQKLLGSMQGIQTRTKATGKQLKQVQRQLNQAKQQLQGYSSLRQSLKIQKIQQSKKSTKITELQTRLSQLQKLQGISQIQRLQRNQKLQKVQKLYKQLKKDYNNLQQINEETNQKTKKTIQSLKKQMNDMNEQLSKQNNNIENKKRQMKIVEKQYLARITTHEDQNMSLKAKVKRQELHTLKLQSRLKQVQQQHIQHVTIPRTQLISYKQTQGRFEDCQQQINSILTDRNRIDTQKKQLQARYLGQIYLLKNNYSSQREELLRGLAQTEEVVSYNELKICQLNAVIQKKRKQAILIQAQIQSLTKQNYQIKLQLSQTLSQSNVRLVKNKVLGQKLSNMQNQFDQLKLSHEKLSLQKIRSQKDKMTTNGIKVQLQMGYKKIQRLNNVLMEKQRQIAYLLTLPTGDKPTHRESHQGIYKDGTSMYTYEYTPKPNNDRQHQMQYGFGKGQTFGLSELRPHYESNNSKNLSYNGFVKQNNQISYAPKSGPSNPDNSYINRKAPLKNNKMPQKYIGGFPAKYCTFAPQYHQI